MNLASIIAWLLWRFRPALWLHEVVRRLAEWAIALLEDEDKREWLKDSPASCSWFAGWLAVGEARLDELIYLRACEILNLGSPSLAPPVFVPLHSVRTLDECFIRLACLLARFNDAERLARLRALRMRRETDRNPFDLVATLAAAMPQAGLAVSIGSVSSFTKKSAPNACCVSAVAQRIHAPP